jgi:hypothetical protein
MRVYRVMRTVIPQVLNAESRQGQWVEQKPREHAAQLFESDFLIEGRCVISRQECHALDYRHSTTVQERRLSVVFERQRSHHHYQQ